MKQIDELDFPAAHSMDSQWFGVDDEGNIAMFISGESGAKPKHAVEEEDWDTTTLPIYLDDFIAEQDGKIFSYYYGYRPIKEMDDRFSQQIESDCLAWFSSPQVLVQLQADPKQLIAKKDQKSFRKNLADLIDPLNHPLPIAVLKHASAQCLRELIKQKMIHRVWVGFRPETWRFGIFVFKHDTKYENRIAGPYLPQQKPMHVLNFSHLPGEIRQRLCEVQFVGVKFTSCEMLQPFEYFECWSWVSEWVDSIGEVHDLESKE